MLADDICEHGIVDRLRSDMNPTLKAIAGAQKYVLAPQFAAVADALGLDFTTLTRAFPFCRLPYHRTWIELVHMDRPHFAAADLQAPDFQKRPKRIGFLLEATRDDLSAWKAHLFWDIVEHDLNGTFYHAAGVAMDFDLTHQVGSKVLAANLEPRDARFPASIFANRVGDHPGWVSSNDTIKQMMLDHTCPRDTDYDIPYHLKFLSEKEYRQTAKLMMQLAASDWAGESSYLLACIGLMNARNAVEKIPRDLTKLNKARKKRRRPALFEHHLLKIHGRQQRRVGLGDSSDYSAMRGHFVAGHWKVRKTGIFFWKPFARGDFSKGQVTKDYQLS